MDHLVSMKKRIVEIAYKNKLSHLGSYFSCLPVVDEIYSKKEGTLTVVKKMASIVQLEVLVWD